ncbi:vWA domain-containing protein [Marinimicrobium sp. C2-29]|uniref:vWA domain-containing protein n=1 Tax=Marinimicrobium sp. C2-29 TaxID=3139825 RepID=UPI003139A155
MKRFLSRLRVKALTVLLLSVGLLVACSDAGRPDNRAVYLLLDTSGTYTEELEKAQSIIAYLLGALQSGDSIAVARIDSGSFTEKNLIAKVTFDDRPSTANSQKRAFKQTVDEAIGNIKRGSAHTDITGGVIQAHDYLTETGAGQRYLFVFSDLEEDLQAGHIRDFPIEMNGVNVVAINVTKLRGDNIDPREYAERLDNWQARVEQGGGSWRVVNDLERLNRLIEVR